MSKAVCPGSFDPVTNGHIDIFSRASALFDEVVVAVGVNKSKSSARLFAADERMQMLREVTAVYDNVTVAGFEGLLTDFCRDNGIQAHDQYTQIKTIWVDLADDADEAVA